MCCRYLLFRNQLKEMLRQVGVAARREMDTRYNISPGTKIPAIRRKASEAGLELAELRWGLIPSWSKTASGLVNARAEQVAAKPSFREAFRRRRCLIPASGFYEWRKDGRRREPWLFRLQGDEPFFLAGLWEPAIGALEDAEGTCAVITTQPNAVMLPIHGRMPAIVPAETAALWLEPQATEPELAAMLAPFPAERMTARALDGRVNSTVCDDEACLQSADTQRREAQGQLGL